MSNNKQSSVEWLVEKMLTQDWYTYKSLEYIKQAKAMHKEEIENSFVECWKANMPDGYECKLSAKEYYSETFGGNNEQQ